MTSPQERTAETHEERRSFRQSSAASFASLWRDDLFAGNSLAIVTDSVCRQLRLYLLDGGLSIAFAEEIEEHPVMHNATICSAILV
jgi:hypothetical protein